MRVVILLQKIFLFSASLMLRFEFPFHSKTPTLVTTKFHSLFSKFKCCLPDYNHLLVYTIVIVFSFTCNIPLENKYRQSSARADRKMYSFHKVLTFRIMQNEM